MRVRVGDTSLRLGSDVQPQVEVWLRFGLGSCEVRPPALCVAVLAFQDLVRMGGLGLHGYDDDLGLLSWGQC